MIDAPPPSATAPGTAPGTGLGTALGTGPRRYALRSSTRRTLPILLVLGLSGFIFAGRAVFGIIFGVVTVLNLLFWYLTRTGRHVLVLDDDGYRVEVNGKPKLRVAWGEVKRVQAMPSEMVLHLDCGDAARNLLLPPRFGHGYTYDKQDELYAVLAARFAGRIEENDKLLEEYKARQLPVPSAADGPTKVSTEKAEQP